MKRLLSKGFVVFFIVAVTLVPSFAQGAERQNVTYWTFTGDMYKVENNILRQWNKQNPDNVIIYNPIPAGASSEMIIQTAIATSTAPTITGQLEAFFANYLAREHGALVPLDTLPGFDKVIAAKKAEVFLDRIRAEDGHIYIIPMHWTPALCLYNKKLLNQAGYDTPPKTYSEFNEFASKVLALGDYTAIDFDPTPAWWMVGYYWHTFYMAANGDVQEIGENGLDFDSDVSRAFLEFVDNAFKKGYASPEKEKYKFIENMNVGFRALAGSGDPLRIQNTQPELEFIISSPPVPDFVDPDQTPFVDASVKGLGIVKDSGSVEKAWEFLQWRLTNVDFDVEQLKATGHFAMRGDWLENPTTKAFLDDNPTFKEYAAYVVQSNGIIHSDKVDIYDAVKKEMWEPMIFGKKDLETAVEDAKKAVNAILQK